MSNVQPVQAQRQLAAQHLLVGASGAIGVANLHEYLIALRKFTPTVTVVMTRSARTLASVQTIRAVTGQPVYSDDDASDLTVPHLQLAAGTDVFVVLPASANTLGKAANGIADDLLSSILIARTSPSIFVPSMNPAMWSNAAVQRNVEQLRRDGHRFVVCNTPAPAFETASGEWVLSNLMPTPTETADQIIQFASEIRGSVIRKAHP